jgi:hypothetical protein
MSRVQLLIARFRIACALVAALLLVPGALPVRASGGVVTNCSSDAQFSSLLAGGGTITFNCGTALIHLSSTKLISTTTTIDGAGTITLSGDNVRQLFVVEPGPVLRLRNIVLTSGFSPGDGGAINHSGSLILENSIIRDSRAAASGGAILSYGPLTITNSLLEGNRALNGGALYPRYGGARTLIVNSVLRNNQAIGTNDGWGGALLAWDGAPVTIEGSDIYGNRAQIGGGIYNFANSMVTLLGNTRLRDNIASDSGGGGLYNAGTATLTNVTLSGNSALGDGGGILNTGTATLTNVTLSGNSAGTGGGLANAGTATLTNVTLSGNNSAGFGGGVYDAGTATLSNVTLSGNSAESGGGLFTESGTTILTNVTLSGNSATSDGGGMYNIGMATLTNVTLNSNTARDGGGLYNDIGPATLTNVTFSGNAATRNGGGIHHNTVDAATLINVTLSANSAGVSGGGIYRLTGTVTVKNTIVANSPSGANCAGGVTNSGFNLANDSSCGFTQVPNLMLGPLADNGGPTLTHMPQPGSPAIDFVAAGCPPPTTDQRGASRNVAACDAGAVEYGAIISTVYLPLVRK